MIVLQNLSNKIINYWVVSLIFYSQIWSCFSVPYHVDLLPLSSSSEPIYLGGAFPNNRTDGGVMIYLGLILPTMLPCITVRFLNHFILTSLLHSSKFSDFVLTDFSTVCCTYLQHQFVA